MSKLVPYQQNILIPHDTKLVAPVYCFPGSNAANFEGAAALTLTPDAVVLCTKDGVIEHASFWAIEDVQVARFEGILIERQTSIGSIVTPPPDNYGVEIAYRTEMRLKGRLKVMTFFANIANQWANEIRTAAFAAQTQQMRLMTIKPPEHSNDNNPVQD